MIFIPFAFLCLRASSQVFKLERIVHSAYSAKDQKVGLKSFNFNSLEIHEQQEFSVEIPTTMLHFNDYQQELKLNPQDPKHVLALAKMTLNSYYEPSDSKWVPIPGWEVDYSFGWSSSGIRGYVFSSGEIQVIVIKGTSLSTPIGSGPTAAQDKFNDNMMFSCCCAKGGWEWTPICSCPLTSTTCSVSCLLRQSNFDASYYNLAQTIYLAVKEWSPRASIHMTGHSLGGALASLVALTNKLPAFAFEAPGDLLYASRIGLLPDLPTPGNQKPNYTDFLSSLEIYHFGNTDDPIYMGTCHGISSSCYWFDYALESQCHVGYECTYTSSFLSKETKNDSTNDALLSSIKYHSIEWVIKNYLQDATSVPKCKVNLACMENECSSWTWVLRVKIVKIAAMFWSIVLFISQVVGFLSLSTYAITLLSQSLMGFWEQNLAKKYQSQWAFVTGGSSGIGYAIVQKLASQGINVVIAAYPDRLLSEKMAALKLQFPSVEFKSIGLDLSMDDAMEKIANETNGLKINLVFNNAGYIKPGLFATLPIEVIMANYHTNATITIKITHHFLNLMISRKEKGLICFTGSSGGFIPGPMSSIYSSTKAWMTNFAASLAAETVEDGIDILCIHPSPIASNFYENASNMSALQMVKKIAASPEVIASTVFKLAGKTTIVDQGMTSMAFKLILKMMDWNLLTDIMVRAVRHNDDYKMFKNRTKVE